MKTFKRIVSWCLVPVFIFMCGLYGVSIMWPAMHKKLQTVIDKFVSWNDCVLMGKKKAGER